MNLRWVDVRKRRVDLHTVLQVLWVDYRSAVQRAWVARIMEREDRRFGESGKRWSAEKEAYRSVAKGLRASVRALKGGAK